MSKKSKIINIVIIAAAGLLGLALGVFLFIIGYMNMERGRIIRHLTIETGSPIIFEDFFAEPVPHSSMVTDVSSIDTTVPGTYQLRIKFWRFRQDVILDIVDTTAPTAEAVPQT